MIAPWKQRSFWMDVGWRVLWIFLFIALYEVSIRIYPQAWRRLTEWAMTSSMGPIWLIGAGVGWGILASVPLLIPSRSGLGTLKIYDRWKRLRCTKCDYDIRAQNPGQACPECGTDIPERSALPLPHPPVPIGSRRGLLLLAATAMVTPALFLLLSLDDQWDALHSALMAGLTLITVVIAVLVIKYRHQRWRSRQCMRCGVALGEEKDRCWKCGTMIPVARDVTIEDKPRSFP